MVQPRKESSVKPDPLCDALVSCSIALSYFLLHINYNSQIEQLMSGRKDRWPIMNQLPQPYSKFSVGKIGGRLVWAKQRSEKLGFGRAEQ
jgi:hypothetical protein